MREAVVVSYARTGLAKSARGGFNITPTVSMAAHAVKHAVEKAGVEKDAVDGYLLQNALALTCAKAGANSNALDLLEKLTGKPFGPEYGTLLAPDWDPIRAEPRFQKVLAGLAPNPSK